MINLEDTIITVLFLVAYLLVMAIMNGVYHYREMKRVRQEWAQCRQWLERGIVVGTDVDTTSGKARVLAIIGKKRIKVEFVSGPRDGEVVEVEE